MATALGATLAWLALVPGLFDVAEDVLLLRILAFGGLQNGTLPGAAYWCATMKFGVGAVVVILGVPFAAWTGIRSRPRPA